MQNTPNDLTPDAAAVFAHRGVLHQLSDSLDRLPEELRVGALEVKAATQEDRVSAAEGGPLLAPATRRELRALIRCLSSACDYLDDLQSYWYSLPWAEELGPDPRANRIDSTPPVAPETPNPINPAVAEACTALERAERLAALNCESERRSELSSAQLSAGFHDSPPSAEHAPETSAAKRVVNLSISQDARTRTTVGKAEVEFVTGGPPAVWFHAEDGSAVVIHQEDFSQVLSVFQNLTPII